ncbi:MAG: aspartate/glutamate racemase family protein [Clostridia bacterium]|nr:aspartate/glutamate racemase family protein [Clostridia bacterium]
MIGVFDSGAGGVSAVLELSALLPRENIIFLADRKNAPYGTKTETELLRLMRQNIRRLAEMGAERILIACCTASALWQRLPEWERSITLPIITLTAESIPAETKRVAVIATEYTVKSHAFEREIGRLRPDLQVAELALQSLVQKVEIYRKDQENLRLENIIKPELERIDGLIKSASADSLILGCTHFSWVESILKNRYPKLTILNPARLGAIRLATDLSAQKGEQGRVTYTQ